MAIEKNTNTHIVVEKLFSHCKNTFRHSLRVGDELYRFANQLGMKDTDNIYLLGILHDIGKVNIPISILDKTTPLTKNEFQLIKRHTEFGQNIIAGIKGLPAEYSTVVRYHHENFDGTGYYGLSKDDIPLLSRMIRIIDSYDTMLHGRVYKGGKKQREVIDEILYLGGQHYDPELVIEYKELLNKNYTLQLVSNT